MRALNTPRSPVFVTIVVALALNASPAAAQPVEWATADGGNGHSYELVTTPANWDDAKLFAEARFYNGAQGHLVAFNSAAELAFVIGAVTDARGWTGGFQLPGHAEPAGSWAWVTGEPFDASLWRPGEPNDAGGEDCAETGNGLNDFKCNRSQPYLVEYGNITTPALPWSSATTTCPDVPVDGTVSIRGLTPNGEGFLLFGGFAPSFLPPTDPLCPGVPISVQIDRAESITADASGEATFSLVGEPAGICDDLIQVIDLTTCLVSPTTAPMSCDLMGLPWGNRYTCGCALTRYEDLGDSVLDYSNCHIWEKKTPSNVDLTYDWLDSQTTLINSLAGRALRLPCPSGGEDWRGCWRLPQREEFRTILLEPEPCAATPCMDPALGPIGASPRWYWTVETHPQPPPRAWVTSFDDGSEEQKSTQELWWARGLCRECADPNAIAGPTPAPTPIPDCVDGADNDDDGLVDFPADSGCSSAGDPSERSSVLPCDDGIDNDGDGRTDFDPVTFASPGDVGNLPSGQGDPGCASPTAQIEDPACQNGVDDPDPDPQLDYDAGFSANGAPNPIGPDLQCIGRPWHTKERQSCGLGLELALLLPGLAWLRRRQLS